MCKRERERERERGGGGGGKMSATSTSSLSVELLSRVIDVKYDCLTLYLYRYYIGVSLGYKADTPWDKDTHLTV